LETPKGEIMKTKWEILMEAARTGKFFSCTFIKRTTGERRKGVFRIGVKKHLHGGDPVYDFKEKDLLPVWDVQKEAYRTIPVESIIEISLVE